MDVVISRQKEDASQELEALRAELAAAKARISELENMVKFVSPFGDVKSARKSSEEIWRYLVESAPDLIMMVDRDGKILYRNHYPKNQTLPDSLWEDIKMTVIPEHRERVVNGVMSVFETGQMQTYELASPHIPGKITWYMTRLGPITQHGKVAAVIMMIRDITAMKETEVFLARMNEELERRVKERTSALRESNERHRVISELIPDYVYSARYLEGGESVIDWCSGAFEQITGYSLEETNGSGFFWRDLVHPDDRSRLEAQWMRIRAIEPNVAEYRIVTRGGEVRWIQDYNKPVSPTDGAEGIRVWGAVQDITQRKAAEEAMRRYARRLEASLKLSADLRRAERRGAALAVLARQSAEALGADISCGYQVDQGELRLETCSSEICCLPDPLNSHLLPRLPQALASGELLVADLTATMVLGAPFDEQLQRAGVQTVVFAPLRTSQETIGLLLLGFKGPFQMDPDDRQLLDTFAEIGGNALQRILAMELLEGNVAHRERELQVLYDVMATASETSDMDDLVNRSLDRVLAAVGCEIGVLNLVDPADGQLKVVAHRGWTTSLCNRVQQSELGMSHEDVLTRGHLLLAETLLPATADDPEQFIAYLGAPIFLKGKLLGVLGVFGDPRHLNDPGLSQVIRTITDQLGLAIESLRLHKQAEQTAIFEERQRLARDLHDSVSQSLYGLVISADVCNKFLKIKEYDGLQETLESIESGALRALKEMRLMLFELRPVSLGTEGLVKALELRLNTVERRAGAEAQLKVHGANRIPTALEPEIYRVATEALNNALKHSGASDVQVLLDATSDDLVLQVTDNGRGFDSAAAGSSGFGLSGMRERARKLNGTLLIETSPDHGARIRLCVPLATAK